MEKQQTTNSSSHGRHRQHQKSVSFGTVGVREYPVVLSTNPGGGNRYGAALELGWEYRLASEVVPSTPHTAATNRTGCCRGPVVWSVEEYETIRPSPQRRTLKSLFLFGNQREYRLKKNFSYTDQEIQQAVAEKARIVRNRERTLRVQSLRVGENWSTVNRGRKIRRAVHNLKTKQPKASSHEEIYRGWWLPLSAHFF